MSCASLFVLLYFGQSPWLFLFFGEILTLIVWFISAGISHKNKSRFLLLDKSLELSGNVINFSVNKEILSTNTALSPSELLPKIKFDIDEFVGEAPQFDDITMLCLEYRARMED